jgi:hypothetical protein
LPERPSKRLQQFHIQGAIYGPPHQGPISRPHPHREPVLIDAPLELLADPTRWTSHRCRHRSHTSIFGELLSVRASYARCSSFPQASTGGPGRDFGIRVAGPGQKDFGGLPACQTILNAIGDLLAYGRQVEKLLFAENIFGFVGKSPIHRRLVPKVVIPIHVRHCA